MNTDGEKTGRITALLRENPDGLSISEIAHRLQVNRNSLAKYLDLLLIAGRVEVQQLGAARVFYPARRMPLTTILGFPSGFVVVLDRDGKIVQVNDRYLRFFGLPRAEVQGAFLETSSLPLLSDIPHASLFGSRTQDYGRIVREQHITRDGSEHWFRVTCVPTVLEEGTAGTLIVMEDITVERRQGIALALSEARYRAITDGHTDLVCRFLPDQTLTYVNESWCLFFGTSEDQVVGRPAGNFLAPADREPFTRLSTSCTQEEPQFREELPFISATGEIRRIDWIFRAIYSQDTVCREFQAIGRDVTDLREAKAILQQHESSLDSVSHLAGELAEIPDTRGAAARIARHILILQPGAHLVMVFLPDREEGTVILQAQEGAIPPALVRLFAEREGQIRFSISPVIEKAIKEKTCIPFTTDYLAEVGELSQAGVIRPESDLFHEYHIFLRKLGIGEVYAMGLIYGGVISGYAGVFLKKDQPLVSPGILRMYLHIAATHLAHTPGLLTHRNEGPGR